MFFSSAAENVASESIAQHLSIKFNRFSRTSEWQLSMTSRLLFLHMLIPNRTELRLASMTLVADFPVFFFLARILRTNHFSLMKLCNFRWISFTQFVQRGTTLRLILLLSFYFSSTCTSLIHHSTVQVSRCWLCVVKESLLLVANDGWLVGWLVGLLVGSVYRTSTSIHIDEKHHKITHTLVLAMAVVCLNNTRNQ